MNDLKAATNFATSVIDQFYPPNDAPPGLPMPWKKTAEIYFAPNALSVWTGFNGHGKSLMLNQVLLSAVKGSESSCIASFEMPARKTIARMVRQATGQSRPDPNEICQCLEWLGDKVWIYDRLGTADRVKMLACFEAGISKHGIKHIVIDSLMKCGIAVDDLDGQKKFVDSLQNFAQSHPVHVHLVAHARKDRDEDNPPGKMDVKGAGEITDLADNVFAVWRNKPKERALAEGKDVDRSKYDAILDCLKFREDGEVEGRYGFYFHPPSMQYLEHQYAEPQTYL